MTHHLIISMDANNENDRKKKNVVIVSQKHWSFPRWTIRYLVKQIMFHLFMLPEKKKKSPLQL